MHKNYLVLTAILSIAAAILIANSANASDPVGKKGAPEMDPKALQDMLGRIQPGPMHAKLKPWEGEWDVKTKFWMAPGLPPTESTQTASTRVVMGGRYVIENVKGAITLMGRPTSFEGISIIGFDVAQNKFFTTWIDNISTGLWTEWGTMDDAGKVLTTTGENTESMSGQLKKSRTVVTWADNDHRTLEMWEPGSDGVMVKNFEVTYTRRK